MSEAFKKEVLDQLREHGSDVTKPHSFGFYIYVPTELDAKKATDKIRQSGFSCADVSRSAAGSSWLCLATKTLVPEKADLSDHARFFEQIAAALGGEFDGWEAEIVEI